MKVKGIRRTRGKIRAYVRVGTAQREKWFPADTKLKTVHAWRDETRLELRKKTSKPGEAGSL